MLHDAEPVKQPGKAPPHFYGVALNPSLSFLKCIRWFRLVLETVAPQPLPAMISALDPSTRRRLLEKTRLLRTTPSLTPLPEQSVPEEAALTSATLWQPLSISFRSPMKMTRFVGRKRQPFAPSPSLTVDLDLVLQRQIDPQIPLQWLAETIPLEAKTGLLIAYEVIALLPTLGPLVPNRVPRLPTDTHLSFLPLKLVWAHTPVVPGPSQLPQ